MLTIQHQTNILIRAEVFTYKVGNTTLTMEAARGSKFFIRTSSEGKNDDIIFGNADQRQTKDISHLLAEARSDTPGGIYPQQTIFTYTYEDKDSWKTFDHEAGIYYAHSDGEHELSFYCQRTCGGEEEKIYIYKNGYPISKFSCFGSSPFAGWVANYQPLLVNDTYNVFSGTANILLDEMAYKMQVYFIEQTN